MLQQLHKSFPDIEEYESISGVLRRMLHPDLQHRCTVQEVLSSALPKLAVGPTHHDMSQLTCDGSTRVLLRCILNQCMLLVER